MQDHGKGGREGDWGEGVWEGVRQSRTLATLCCAVGLAEQFLATQLLGGWEDLRV